MPTTISIVTVLDSITHNPVTSASVFLNGVGAGIPDSQGNVQLSVTLGQGYTISAKASGYKTVTSQLNGGSDVQVQMVPNQTAQPVTLTLTINPESVADGQTLTVINGINNTTAIYKTGGTQIPNLAAGDVTISASFTGYNAVNSLFTLTTSSSQTINLTAGTDTGLANKQQQINPLDPDTSTMLPAITPEQSPEFVAPNTGQGTYFTMTQARMYIGNLFIDELNSLQFALQDNKIPIFGYASRFMDAVGQGKSLVQGQFTINFISEGYLTTVLKEYTATIGTNTTVPTTTQQQQARLLTLTNQLSNPNGADPSWTPTMIQNAKNEIAKLAAALGPDALALAQAGMSANVRDQLDNTLGLAGGDYPNAIYQDVPFDIVIQYSGAGRVVMRRLEQCFLISNECIMDQSGNPILDAYGFICRRLR